MFATEKRAFERRQGGIGVPIMAFALQDAAQAAAAAVAAAPTSALQLGPIAYTADVLRTGIFGSQQIVGEFVSGLEVITLPTPLDTLSFGLDQTAALATS